MFLKVSLLALLLAALSRSAPVDREHDYKNLRLIILHNNDMHARFEQTGKLSDRCGRAAGDRNECFGGFPRVAAKVKEFRRKAKAGEIPSVLYLNAGDTYSGTPWFATYKDEIAADFMNLLRPDAMVRSICLI